MKLFAFGRKSPPKTHDKLCRSGRVNLPPMGETTKAGGYDFFGRDADDALYDEMLKDPQVAACVAVKKSTLLAGGWEITPGGSGDEDKAAADTT